MRTDQLTFTRFFAAISIVIFHYGNNIFPFYSEPVDFLFKQANIGVSYFFILSGFVMIIAYKERGEIEYVDFVKRRFARIYPVYALAILVLLIYYILILKSFGYKSVILNLTLLQSWVPGFALSFNTPGWSLAVEMFFYISFPFLFNHFYNKYSLKSLLVPIILFFFISQLAFLFLTSSTFYDGFPSKSHDILYFFPLMHFNEFLIGNLAGMFFLRGIKVRNYDFYIITLIFLLGFLLKINTEINLHNGMLAFVFVPLIILISANNGLLTRLSNKKFLVFLGEISYSIYILQKPIFLWVEELMKYFNITNSAVIFYLALLILILFSAISYKYFEIPMRELINKKRISISNKTFLIKNLIKRPTY